MPVEDFTSVYCATSEPFLNSKCLFVEFMDMIAIPWYNILRFASTSEQMHEVYSFKEFDPTDNGECLEWYVNRKHRNIFSSLNTWAEVDVDGEFHDRVLSSLEKTDEVIFLSSPQLMMHKTINSLIRSEKGELLTKPIVEKIVIYSERENPFIKKYIEKLYGKPSYLSYVYGDLVEVLKDIPKDTTYAFSDIKKINILKDHDKLEFSSVLVPGNYRYNFDDEYNLLCDIEALKNDYIFKFDLIDVFKGAEL